MANQLTFKFDSKMVQELGSTSGIEMDVPLIDDTAVAYFVGIDWVVSKGEKERSKSRTCGADGASKLVGKVFACCKRAKKMEDQVRTLVL